METIGEERRFFTQYRWNRRRMLKQIKHKLRQVHDNPNIKRMDKRCFIIKHSELVKHDNWTPTFHDFGAQCAMVAERVVKCTDPIRELKAVIRKGSLVMKKQCRGVDRSYTQKLHPDVLTFLKVMQQEKAV